MEVTQAGVRRATVFGAVGAIAVFAVIAIAVVGVTRASNLSTKVDRLSSQVMAAQQTDAQLQAKIDQANTRLQAKISQQDGTSSLDVDALRSSVSKLQARVKLYDTCVPEIMGQIDSLSANVTGTGPLYLSPSQSVSRYCAPVLYGEPNVGQGG